MKKYSVAIMLLMMVMCGGIVAAAEPTTTAAHATVEAEFTKKPLVAYIAIVGQAKGEKRVFYADDVDVYLKYAPSEIKQRVVPYYSLPQIMKLDPTTLKDPATLKPIASQLGVERIIVTDVPAAFVAKEGKYKGAYVGEYHVYVMDFKGNILADFTKTRVVVKEEDAEKIKTEPGVMRYVLSKDLVTYQKNSTKAMAELFGQYFY